MCIFLLESHYNVSVDQIYIYYEKIHHTHTHSLGYHLHMESNKTPRPIYVYTKSVSYI